MHLSCVVFPRGKALKLCMPQSNQLSDTGHTSQNERQSGNCPRTATLKNTWCPRPNGNNSQTTERERAVIERFLRERDRERNKERERQFSYGLVTVKAWQVQAALPIICINSIALLSLCGTGHVTTKG